MSGTPGFGRRAAVVSVIGLVLLPGCGGHGLDQNALVREGRRVFATARCGSCHTLAAARAKGRNGPDLDTSERLSRAQIRQQLEIGVGGMPSFSGRLNRRQQEAVTEFVFDATHARR